MADAFFKGFGEGLLFVPQLAASAVGIAPPPALFKEILPPPKLFQSIEPPLEQEQQQQQTSSSSFVSSDAINASGTPATILGMDQNTALLVGGGVLLLLLLI
jgi:hypothetical protein